MIAKKRMAKHYALLLLVFLLLSVCTDALTTAANKLERQNPGVSRRRAFLKHLIVTSSAIKFVDPALALSPDQAEIKYDKYAASYDQLDGGKASSLLGIDEARLAMIQQAKGNVLEIGVGTGLNLDKYVGEEISSLTLLDISDGMLKEAIDRVKTLPNLKDVKVQIVKADATTELVDRFGLDSFDTVIDSFSLCVMGNDGARKCLDQISRVVKPGSGQVLLLENSRSSNPILGLYQDVTADAAASAGGKGCVYNQDVGSMIRKTGLLSIESESAYAAGLFRFFKCKRI